MESTIPKNSRAAYRLRACPKSSPCLKTHIFGCKTSSRTHRNAITLRAPTRFSLKNMDFQTRVPRDFGQALTLVISIIIAVPLVLLLFPGKTHATEVVIDNAISTNDSHSNNASPQLVWISDTEGFAFYIDNGRVVSMASTTNSGATWGNVTTVDSVNTNDGIKVSVWYDRWTPGDTTGNLIHIATLDSGDDDTYYTQYNTVTNQVSTTVVTGTQVAAMNANNTVSITKAENGTLYVTSVESADGWVHTCSSSCTSSSNWSAITSPYTNGNDHMILLPLGGTNNIMLLWWDISDDDIESNIYSATSTSWWGWNTGISQNEPDEPTYGSAMMGATINRTTGEIYFAYIADNGVEYTVQDHDIDIWEFNNSTFVWSQKTASALVNMSGGLTGVKISVDENTGDLYLAYLRRTTIGTITTTNVYWRKSTDNGETWGAEQGPLNSAADDIRGLSVNIMSDERIGAMWKYAGTIVDEDGLYHETIVNLSPGGGTPSRKMRLFEGFGIKFFSGKIILYGN